MAGFSDSDGEPRPSVLSPAISAGIQTAAAATHVYPSTEKVGRIRPPLCRSTNQDTLASRLVLNSSDSDDEAAPAAAAGSLACRQPRSRAPTATSAAPVSGGVRVDGHGVEDTSVELVVLSSDSDDGSDAGDVHRHTHPASSEQDISLDEPRLGVDEASSMTTRQSDGSPGSATLRFVPTLRACGLHDAVPHPPQCTVFQRPTRSARSPKADYCRKPGRTDGAKTSASTPTCTGAGTSVCVELACIRCCLHHNASHSEPRSPPPWTPRPGQWSIRV